MFLFILGSSFIGQQRAFETFSVKVAFQEHENLDPLCLIFTHFLKQHLVNGIKNQIIIFPGIIPSYYPKGNFITIRLHFRTEKMSYLVSKS